jgi:hypothetical protein
MAGPPQTQGPPAPPPVPTPQQRPPMTGPGGLSGGQQPPGQQPYPNFNTPIEPLRVQPRKNRGIMEALGSPENMASLASGLKAVGNNWNKPGLAAFAGTAGSAMEGGQKKGEQEDQDQMKRNQQQFQQTSTAFNDMLKAQASGNANKINDARANYFNARAQQMVNGGTGSNAWQNTPYGRAVQVEQQVSKFGQQRETTLREQWKINGTPKAQQDADLAKLETEKDAMRGKLGQQFGLSGGQVKAIANTGTEPPTVKGADGKDAPNPNFNPFDVRTMNVEQFRAQVPMGAYYRDTDGKVYKRTQDQPKSQQNAPKPKEGQESANEQPKTSALQQQVDDEEAASEAA